MARRIARVGNPRARMKPPKRQPAQRPAAASPTPTGVPPFDAGLEARRTSGMARRSTLLSDLDVDVQQRAQETGFQYNPATGAFGGFDPTNPFSQAALLMQARQQNRNRSQQDYAQAGQLNAGAYEGAKAYNEFQSDKAYDTLKRGFDDYVKQYLRRKRDIQTVNPEELASL